MPVVLCQFCGKEMPDEPLYGPNNIPMPYCSVDHLIEFHNVVRLSFGPYKLGRTPTEISNAAHASFLPYIEAFDTEELAQATNVWIRLIIEARALVYKKKGKDKEVGQTKIRSELARREGDMAKAVEKERAVQELRKQGEKISKSGRCLNCGNVSTAELCSQPCKNTWKLVRGWMRIGISEEKARDMANKALGKGASI